MSDANISSVVRANTSGSASGSGTFIPGNRLGKAREFVRNLKVVAIDSTIKHVVDAATELVGISQALQQTNKEWKEFGAYIQEHVDLAVRFLSSPSVLDDSLRESLERLNGTLQELLVDARAARAEQGTIRQTTSHAQDSGVVIKQMREKLDRTLTLFNMTFNITNRLDVARLVLSVSDIERTIPDIAHTLEETRALQGPLPRVIMDLPITEGTSWDPDRTCLPGTRTWILDEIMDWIHGPDAERGAKVFWLTGPAGSGKTTVAHTVSQAAHDAGILLLSFFFNRMIPDRTSPNRLITALARAVATTDKRRALQMASVLQDDAGLASTSVTRQFQELVVKPASSGSQSVTRCVIVIDGVDECMDPEDRLLSILTSGTFVLPPWLRIVVTSRPLSKSHSLLEKATHITTHNFDLRSDDHRNDMKLYMSHRLELVARKRRKVLPSTAENLIEILAYRSDGLFLWASTVMDFMENHINPERHIKALLSWEGAPDAEARMDEVYAMVLSACPWHDEDFVAGYHLYMGMIEVGKGLSISTMQALSTRPDISPLDIFGYFRCLLRNWDNNDEAIEVLHSTFLAYICYRSPAPFRLNVVDSHTALAKGCIAFLNDELVFDRTGILSAASLDEGGWSGGLNSPWAVENVPHLMAFSAQFNHHGTPAKYACTMWFWHLSNGGDKAESLHEELSVLLTTRQFLSSLCLYVVVLDCDRTIPGELLGFPQDVLIWMEKHRNWFPNSYALIFSIEMMDKMEALSRWLFYSSLPDPRPGIHFMCEHLARGSVIIARTLSRRLPGFDRAKLAKALQSQAVVSSGFSEEGKTIMEEAISIYRQLSIGEAGPHHRLGTCLSEASRYVFSQRSTREEAISSAEEALEIFASIGLQADMPVVTERLRCLNVLLQWRGPDPQTLHDAVEGWRDVTNSTSSTFMTELPDTLLHVIRSRTSEGDLLGAIDASEELLSVIRSERERLHGTPRGHCPRKLLESASLLLFEHGCTHEALGLLRECLAFRKADIDWAEARGGSRSDLYIEDRECTEAIYAAQAKNLPKHTEPATVPAEWLPASFQFQDIFFWARTGLCKAAEILSDLGWKEEALAIVSDDRVRYSLLGSQGEWSVRIMHPQTLLEVGNTEEALQVLQHTKSVLNGLDYLFEHPDFGWNLVQALGANLCSSGRAEEALPILKKMAHGSSYMFRPPTQTIASIHLWLSRALLVLGRLEEAAEAAGKGLKIQQKRLDMWPRSILLRQSVEELKQIIEMCSGSEALEEIELARAGKGEERGAAEGTEQCKSAEGNFRWTELVLAWLVAVYFSGLYFVFDQFCLHNL